MYVCGDCEVERRAELDGGGAAFLCDIVGVDSVGDGGGFAEVGGERFEELFGVCVNLAGELDLARDLIGCGVELLFGEDDAEDVDYDREGQGNDQDVDYGAYVVQFAAGVICVLADLVLHVCYRLKTERPHHCEFCFTVIRPGVWHIFDCVYYIRLMCNCQENWRVSFGEMVGDFEILYSLK